jgi:hypothetical protein
VSDFISGDRLRIWAAAQSIYRTMEFLFPDAPLKKFKPSLLTTDGISFGACGLLFSDGAFRKVLRGGFALPDLKRILRQPGHSVQCLKRLMQVKSLHSFCNGTKEIRALLAGSIEAILTYANLHPYSKSLLTVPQHSTIRIGIVNSPIQLLIYFDSLGNWNLKEDTGKRTATCSLEFKNHEVARLASLGQLDPWHAVALGSLTIGGQLPIVEKFGYISRIVQREVPRPQR